MSVTVTRIGIITRDGPRGAACALIDDGGGNGENDVYTINAI